MNVLVIAPHPDDEAIGPGGTLWKHSRRGDRIRVVFLTSGELGLKSMPAEQAWDVRESEARRATRVLGIEHLDFLRLPDWGVDDHRERAIAALGRIMESHPPNVIYLPHTQDDHPDHAACVPVMDPVLEAYRGPSPRVLAYELWSPMLRFDEVEDISDALQYKLQAISL